MYAQLKKCEAKEHHCAQYLEDRLWRRIVGGSLLICDSIRYNAKVTLRRKFEDLLSKSRSSAMLKENTVDQEQDLSSRSEIISVPNISRVTVLGGMSLSEEARSLLEMGPSFSPSQPISTVTLRKIACSLHEVQDKLCYKAKLEKLNKHEEREEGALPPIPFPRTCFRQQDPDSDEDKRFRVISDDTLRILNHFRAKKFCSNLSAVQKIGMKQVRNLIRSKTIGL